MIEVLQSAPVLSRALLIVLLVFLVLTALQLVRMLFASFRSWKFSVGVLVLALLAAWGCMHLYAVTFIRPDVRVVEKSKEPEPNESSANSPSDSDGEDGKG